MKRRKLHIMRYENEQTIRSCAFQSTPQSTHQRRVKMNLGLIDDQSLVFRNAKHLCGKIENRALAIAHLSARIQLFFISLLKHSRKLCVFFDKASMGKDRMPNSIKFVENSLRRMRFRPPFLLLRFATSIKKMMPINVLLR